VTDEELAKRCAELEAEPAATERRARLCVSAARLAALAFPDNPDVVAKANALIAAIEAAQ
jgi:hypothetical protein